ncbi:MAG: hypothetical protein KF842_07340 [Caulobacter sp.]|nr:hypothetical protein [Caulobacter sp.]
MSLSLTLWLTAALIATTVLAGWRGARPPDLIKGPRMIPWRAIMVGSAAGAAMLGAHAAVLIGVITPN